MTRYPPQARSRLWLVLIWSPWVRSCWRSWRRPMTKFRRSLAPRKVLYLSLPIAVPVILLISFASSPFFFNTVHRFHPLLTGTMIPSDSLVLDTRQFVNCDPPFVAHVGSMLGPKEKQQKSRTEVFELLKCHFTPAIRKGGVKSFHFGTGIWT